MGHRPARRSADRGAERRPRLLALDIDGTLLTDEHVLAPEVIRALEAADNAGMTLALATSRSPGALAPILAELPMVRWAISLQGGLLIPARDGRLLGPVERSPLPDGAAPTIAATAVSAQVTPLLYERDRTTTVTMDDRVAREVAITGDPVEVEPDPGRLNEVYKVLCISDADDRHGLAAITRDLPEGCRASRSHPHYLEVTADGVDKAVAVERLAARLGTDLGAVAAIGDGDNDLAMLQVVGTSIAMGNASAGVRRIADWITDSNQDGGVAKAIERLLEQP